MLILVGVTVTVAINGGLFKSAKEGAEGTTIARVKEQMMGEITTKIAEKLGDNITESELETIAQYKEQMRALLDKAEAEKRALDASEKEQFEQLKTK